jgi:alkanesulfonate monooxygenase SsuD/methylene tetrahydromethanopterin reductase-like flavin-dependent oxidoreductase (luciferase family)
LPGAFVVVGDSVAEARAKKAQLDALVHPDSGMARLSVMLGTDASGFELDAPLPTDLPDTNAIKSSRAKLIEASHRDGMTVRQLAQMLGGAYGLLEFIGTPDTIADEMGQWLFERGCDGFNIMFPTLPEGLDDFVDKVVPALQRRGLFRTEYEGRTLQENLGLRWVENRFFSGG